MVLIIAQSPLQKAATPDESNLFCKSQFPLWSWAISYTVHCAFVWLFFPFYSLYLIQFIIQGPFVPPLSGHTKRCTQDGAFFTFWPLLPWDAGSAKNTWSKLFFLCTRGTANTERGKAGEAPKLKDKRFWEALAPKANFWGPHRDSKMKKKHQNLLKGMQLNYKIFVTISY